MGFWFLAILVSIPGGIGFSKMIMTIILEKSNVVGNSLSETEMISSPVSYYDKQERVKYHAIYNQHYMKALKTIPEYEEARQNSLVKDIDACSEGLCIRDGEVCTDNELIEPIVEVKIDLIPKPADDITVQKIKYFEEPKRSWKDAVEDPIGDLSEFDPDNRDWHK